MKTTKISLSLAVIMVAGALAFTSCAKKAQTPPVAPDNEQTSATDNATAENTSNDVIAMGSQLSENSGTFSSYRGASEDLMFSASCATITSNAAGTVVATGYTVDFGTGCIGQDNRTRSGKLYYDFSGSTNNAKWYRNPGFKMTISSSGYAVDGNQVSVTKTVTNTSPLALIGQTAYSGTNLTWSIVANLTMTKANAEVVTWSCNRTKELVNSNDNTCYKGQLIAIDWKKAIIKLNGSATGVNHKGESYTATATDLIRDFNCAPDASHPNRHPFISGKVTLIPGARAARTIDFGSGTTYPNAPCDFNATVTINGQTWAITLP
jgi:hypothetical protein